MSSKSRKSLTPWVTCEKCTSVLAQKDVGNHESKCPPPDDQWSHNYIRNKILHSKIETYSPKELPKYLSETTVQDYVFMSESAMQLCEVAIGSYVILKFKEHIIVKEAFPSTEKNLTSVSLSQRAMKVYNICNGDLVKLQRYTAKPLPPKEIIIKYIGKSMPPNLKAQIDSRKHFAIDQVLSIGNRISIPFYGQDVRLKIIEIVKRNENIPEPTFEISSDNIEETFEKMNITDDLPKYYKPDFSTKWIFVSDENELIINKITITENDIGGYKECLEKLKEEIDVILDVTNEVFTNHRISKGILIHGTAGVGKSTILMAALSTYKINIFKLETRDIYNIPNSEGVKKLQEIFDDAKSQTPSAIIIESIDKLFGKKSNNENLIAKLFQEIDTLHNSNTKCILLATSSKPDTIDPELRCLGRFDSEFEISAPTRQMRGEILEIMLKKLPHAMNTNEMDHVSSITHGFIAADLHRLCSQAAKNAIQRHKKLQSDNSELPNVQITAIDFHEALKKIKPSAMREVLVEVPNVKWTDIGGQESLKSQLKQAVEWPLKYPERFKILGIRPPRGVLMFGPPGCSKTMIARALATESKLNFINIKGSDVYSMWVGESEKAVREIFRKARQVAPSIVFIDEIDALGGERASGDAASGGNSVQERVLTQLLTELDGVTALGDVTFVAATNRPDRIDKALMRPGRLDRKIYVPLPDFNTRREIFEIQFRTMPIDEDVNIDDLVRATEGFSGAEVQAVCREAALCAMMDDRNATKVTRNDFVMALESVPPGTPASLLKLYDDYINKKL